MPIRFSRELTRYSTGYPPKGCRYCDRGSKMVLYITGICAEDCFYCPLSEEKKGKDVMFANERRLEGDGWKEGLLEEARRMGALGTGITGGDPMLFPERTSEVIGILKSEFGKRHHVHLYTTGRFDVDALERVENAGLDEIRFHPPIAIWKQFRFLGRDAAEGDPIEASAYHNIIFEARRRNISTGLEVPSVVDPASGGNLYSEGLHVILDYAAREGLEFVNVNELEASHTNMVKFSRLGYSLAGDSMAVEGSLELAVRTIGKVRNANPDSPTVFHICTSSYKDSVQLRKRLIRTAKRVARPFEIPTEDGTLLRGLVECSDPQGVARILMEEFGVPGELLSVENGTLLVAPWVLEDIGSRIDGVCYLSEVYPTWDGLEVERSVI